MRNLPDTDDKYDAEELSRLKAAPWMVDQLALNPSYTCWGPHEDYMWKDGDGWDSAVAIGSWKEFTWQLDDMNECVNFYFQISRDSEECATCGGNGYGVDAQWVSESFYSHSSPFKLPTAREQQSMAIMDSFGGGRQSEPVLGHGGFPSAATLAKYGPEFRAFCEEMRRHGAWHDRITQDEVDALQEHGRLSTWNAAAKKWDRVPLTADQVNAAQARGIGMDYNHDGINRGILIEARCKRFGIQRTCETCDGHGRTYTAPAAHLQLVLWILHPRKGCSRGVEIKLVEQDDLPAVYAWLRAADARNRERFAKIPTKEESAA